MKTSNQYSLSELCELVDLTPRTVRFYIQKKLLATPDGTGRAAFYHQLHLEQLLEIKKWQQAGLSLERIKEILEQKVDINDVTNLLPPEKPKQIGDIEVCSHIHLVDGLSLQINPSKAKLSSEQIRELASVIVQSYSSIMERVA
ncbi:MAG: MerR family transcriptional regulator [Shewanella sp.]|nr:MerR family transcriptional regulator [Shewanella sp.]